jgi:hypothetical protein
MDQVSSYCRKHGLEIGHYTHSEQRIGQPRENPPKGNGIHGKRHFKLQSLEEAGSLDLLWGGGQSWKMIGNGTI